MNDERPIEKLLRRAAQERNDEAGAPPELHAVNRRLLQAEVARQFPPPPAAPAAAAPTFWGLVTRRWAYALGLIAVVSIAGLMLLPSLSKSKSKSLELAKNTPAESGVSPAMTSEAPAVLQPNATVLSDADSVALRASGGGNNSGRNFEPTTITTPPPAALSLARKDGEYGSSTAAKKPSADRESERLGSLVESRTESADKPVSPDNYTRTVTLAPLGGQSPRSMAAKGEAAPLADATATSTLASSTLVVTNGLDSFATDKAWRARGGGEERQRAPLNSQAFANLDAVQSLEKKKDARANQVMPPPVLVNFKVEQAGRDLRVVDGDGSVYRGVMDEANTIYKQISARQNEKQAAAFDNKSRFQSPKTAAPAQQQNETFYFYQVTGTNRTLNQNVVFSWNFLPTNETVAAAQLNYKQVIKEADFSKQTSQFPDLLQNSYINGRIQYGEGREMEVNAVPVKP